MKHQSALNAKSTVISKVSEQDPTPQAKRPKPLVGKKALKTMEDKFLKRRTYDLKCWAFDALADNWEEAITAKEIRPVTDS